MRTLKDASYYTFLEKIEIFREYLFGPREFYFENGFKLLVSNIGSSSSIFLIHNNKIVLNFSELVPENVIFKLDLLFGWSVDHLNYENPVILIKSIKKSTDILSIFHEIGHANDLEMADISLDSQDVIYYMTQRTYRKSQLLESSFNKIIACERFAWAIGLRKCRKVEQTFGLKILDRVEAKYFVDRCLSTYYHYYRYLR